ncbi:hypothetical protein SPRG_03738 [Saprolegnia parasitica CBS 223.65]|uniref:Uncharacterized protein n=1 Tax=Saprolegnia parasitica (strain CBS 223.65) TaxID=695850 RepID=A0A067CMU8_SAPPC|nr:hypothetical protein SPRG_03738 [Saprolegnia parasitica CBS 223.65]KDO31818.1 hypothetical protein SPRG_03738 [Saprolegnia parasitica CBS 223.65]|eukprot:XP_012197698.1 hypothetical protein SPRG_03738 [Saprolegnia parasitica CBS 223.65]
MVKWNKVTAHALPKRFFRVVIFCMHVSGAGYLALMGYGHWYLTQTAGGYDYATVLRLFQPVSASVAVFASLASLHALYIVRLLLRSVKRHAPCKQYTIETPPPSSNPCVRWLAALREVRRLFRVDGPHYEYKLATKHVVVAASQTYRAYSTSALVGVSSINAVFSCLLFAYGVVVPGLWRFAHMPKQARRQYTLVATIAINYAANILLPTWILSPYFDYFTRPDAATLAYGDTFYPIGVSVCQSILVTSTLDLVLTAITHIFLMTAMADFLRSLDLPPSTRRVSSSVASGALPTKCYMTLMRVFNRAVLAGYVASVLWALGMIVFNYTAWAHPPCMRGCLAQTYPWLTGKCACTVLETTCDGVNDTLTLPPRDSLEVRSLVFLIISHCPRLVMPPSLQAFTNLIGLEIFNSTLVTWDESASIAPLTRFSYAMIVSTNMTDLPLGLFTNAPSTFIDLEISGTNLHQISLHPDLLTTLTVLYIEYGLLDAFPYQLTSLPLLNELSLFSNNIPSVPENLSLPSLNYLQLASNPLSQTIPDAAFTLPALWEMNVDLSNVSAFPTNASVYGSALYVIGAYNSTYCFLRDNATCAETPDCALVSCEPNDYLLGYFPVDEIHALRSATAPTFLE